MLLAAEAGTELEGSLGRQASTEQQSNNRAPSRGREDRYRPAGTRWISKPALPSLSGRGDIFGEPRTLRFS